jgi:hypothetical protein
MTDTHAGPHNVGLTTETSQVRRAKSPVRLWSDGGVGRRRFSTAAQVTRIRGFDFEQKHLVKLVCQSRTAR